MNHTKTYWFLTLIFFIGLFIPSLVHDGMFLDGITYSAISNNLANGYGSYFDPHYTKLLYPHFHEHPPFVFIIHSFFFKIFGSSFVTERIYCLFISLLTIVGIIQCWRLFTNYTALKAYGWLPVILWLSIPVVSWSYKNNLLENTTGVFIIFSVFFTLNSLVKNNIIYLFIF